jgi:anti-sigma B factor antagonist
MTVVDLKGRMTLGEGTNGLREGIRALVTKGCKKILLSFKDVTYVDSSGISETVSAYTHITNNGGTIKLVALPKRVCDLLQISKYASIFEIFDDEAAAIASFNNAAGSGGEWGRGGHRRW